MPTYTDIYDFLKSNNVTHEEMQHMWDSLQESNWKIKRLADEGKNWTDLNISAIKSLIEQYKKGN